MNNELRVMKEKGESFDTLTVAQRSASLMTGRKLRSEIMNRE